MRGASGLMMVGLMLVMSACGANASTPPTTPTATSVAQSNSVDPNNPAVQGALADAASHLGTGPQDLRVTQVEARQWPDSSLGCPQPGLLYSQIVTPGYLIVISSSSGKQLEYHADTRGRAVLCKES